MFSEPGTLSGLTEEEREQWKELIASNPYSCSSKVRKRQTDRQREREGEGDREPKREREHMDKKGK